MHGRGPSDSNTPRYNDKAGLKKCWGRPSHGKRAALAQQCDLTSNELDHPTKDCTNGWELGLPVQVHLQVVASDLRGRQGEFQTQMRERLRARSGNWSWKIENPDEKRLPLVLLYCVCTN